MSTRTLKILFPPWKLDLPWKESGFELNSVDWHIKNWDVFHLPISTTELYKNINTWCYLCTSCYWQVHKSHVIAVSPQNLPSLVEKTILRIFFILIPIMVIVGFNALDYRGNSLELLDIPGIAGIPGLPGISQYCSIVPSVYGMHILKNTQYKKIQ